MTLQTTKIGDDEFARVLNLVREHTGINMDESKRQLVASRLGRRLRALGLRDFQAYIEEVISPESNELQEFINSVTTNLTSFFREPHHFDHLREAVLPALLTKRVNRRLRVWSAGCSTGPEPYSIAMTMESVMANHPGWDWKILATDLDSNVLETARRGQYDASQLESVPQEFSRNYLQSISGAKPSRAGVHERIRDRISFKQLNLMQRWPMKGPFDVIFCRNVAIYFDKQTQVRLFGRFADILADDGTLFIGHSESLYKVTDRFKTVGKTIYEKR